MSHLDLNKIEKINEHYSFGNNAVTDIQLLGHARNYKKRVASRYRLFSEGDIKHIVSDQLFASVKLDGQLHFLYKDADEIFLFNIKGRAITELPLLEEAKQALASVNQAFIVGELYAKHTDSRSRVYDVTKALGGSGEGVETLCFAAFDVLEVDDIYVGSEPFQEKHQRLSTWFADTVNIHQISVHEVDIKGLSQLFNNAVNDAGEEGVVCVDEDNHTVYKIKPRHNVDAVIIGFTESPDTPDSMRVLLTGLIRPDGSIQTFAKVGGGFDDEERREFFRRLTKMTVPTSYNTTDRNHTLFTMVRPEIVIELAFHDVIYENTAGKPEMKAVLKYDAKEGYSPQLPEAFVSVLGPVFKRIREDKEVNAVDLRLTQLADFVDLENLERASRHQDLASSEVIAREVYTKTTKGLISVRKFLTWKTNKDDINEDFPAYVFCYVDYSPGRASPLKRVVRTAPSLEIIEKIFDTFKAKEIKKGWSLNQ